MKFGLVSVKYITTMSFKNIQNLSVFYLYYSQVLCCLYFYYLNLYICYIKRDPEIRAKIEPLCTQFGALFAATLTSTTLNTSSWTAEVFTC
jgi:hypothetical protein